MVRGGGAAAHPFILPMPSLTDSRQLGSNLECEQLLPSSDKKSPFTSSLHTLPLHTPPPADTSHREPFVSPTQQQVCSRPALAPEKAPPLGKNELLIGIPAELGAELGARAEPASSQVGGAAGARLALCSGG